jgi:HPt (histidine-containing phosphotransfer) domain-containing protein
VSPPPPVETTNIKFGTETEAELLQTLRDSLGQEQLQELLASLFTKTDEIIRALNDLQVMDFEFIRARAHEVKGMCGNFGLRNLADLAKRIEVSAKAGIPDGLNDMIRRLPDTYARARQEIVHWLGS